MESYKKSFMLGDKEITLESGKVARQATGAVIATCEDTQVLATVVVGKAPGEHQDFFPLTVNYQEKTYATGKIPGGFFKREGRPTEKETLTSRLIDRPLRPLFNDDLIAENIFEKDIFISGNTVIDALLFAQNKIKKDHELQEKIENEINIDFRVKGSKYILVTGHRRENFGKSFVNICKALKDIASLNKEFKIIYPMHMNPNVVEPVTEMLGSVDNIYLIKPLEYLSFVFLMDNSYLILTDSGGIQEEAPSLGKPVLVMRENTERPEALEHGTVKLVGTNRNKIAENIQELIDNKGLYLDMSAATNPYGDGTASEKILEILINNYEL